MRKISAHLIMDGRGKTYLKGVITLDEKGTILHIEDTEGELHESAGVEFYSGIIVPGFVNAHCHLELSHMEHVFPEGGGFISFIGQVTQNRHVSREEIIKAAERADVLMHKNGIVAVGDIANESTVFELKSRSKICYYTFIEALGFVPDRANISFERAKACLDAAVKSGLKAGVVPHAPYSISRPLFRAISIEAAQAGTILSIHSQESIEEDELYRTGTGELLEHLQHNLSIDTSFFSCTGKNALSSTLEYLPPQNHLLLVHNLNTSQGDINYISEIRRLDNTWFVLCPGSNLYIQKRLPDIDLFRENGLQICLGTDSLGSNHQLSILEEMIIIQTAFPHIPLEELVTWSSFNGAQALKMEEWAGSIEVGKRPGINLLKGTILEEKRVVPGTVVRKLV